MAAITVSAAAADAEEALERLISTEPHLYLSPSPELSGAARITCSHLFSSLLPVCPKPPPLDRLLAGKDFDAEQIWGQIDEMSRPLVSMLRRELKRLEREPPAPHATVPAAVEDGKSEDEEEEDEDEDEEAAADEDRDEEDEDDEDEDDEEESDAGNDENGGGVEDRFLKIKELEEYLVGAEAKEYGHSELRKRREKGEDDGDEDEEDEEDDDDLEFGGFDGDDIQETDVGESARYDDFFGSKNKKGGGKMDIGIKKAGSSKKVKFADELEDFVMDDEHDDDEEEGEEEEEEQEDDEDTEAQDAVLSTHEKELQKLHSRIEQMEKANMEPKSWTMQGEVTAAKRPKNSALEVDLDFEHNTRPAPVITEEVTASIEDLIKKRINEDHFDDVQKAPVLPSKAPREHIELDENKSKKGLAEIYEEEYAQKAGLVAIPLSSSDEQKKEATVLFKNLCVKLDALSHFHFAPKPIIEDMFIQTNVPALAMEEIAPLAVSDASMLAPEEIFGGKGDIKEEAELTQEERKRRRANKKRKHRAGEAKRSAKRVRVRTDPDHLNGSEI